MNSVVVPQAGIGTDMFLIAPGAQELASWDSADGENQSGREKQERLSREQRFRGRTSGMHTIPGRKMASSIFIGRWTPRILFSLRDRPYRHGQLRRELGGVSQRMLTRNSPQSRIRGVNRQAHDATVCHYCRVFVYQIENAIIAPLGGMCRWARRYRKDVSADVRLREGDTA